jgi:hypothetical protein
VTPAERNIRAIERMIRRCPGGPETPEDAPRLYAEALDQYDRRVPAYAPFPRIMPNDRDASAMEIVRRRVRGQLWDDRDHGGPTALLLSSLAAADLDSVRSLYTDDDGGGSLADRRAYVDDETRWQNYLRDRAELTARHNALTPSGHAEFVRRLPAAFREEFGLPGGSSKPHHYEERIVRVQLALARGLAETATEIERGTRLFEFLPVLEAELSPDELLTLEHREQYSLEALAALSGVTRAAIGKREKKVVSKHDAIWHRLFGPIPSPLGRRQRHDG